MEPRTAEPGIDRREHLERQALDVIDRAVDAAQRETATTATGGPVRELGRALLRAVLADFVQSGLEVDRHTRLLAASRAVARSLDVDEYLRTLRVVGLDTIVAHLERTASLTRAEHLRLRGSAERVSNLVVGEEPIGTPGHMEVLRRLQGTGVDLR